KDAAQRLRSRPRQGDDVGEGALDALAAKVRRAVAVIAAGPDVEKAVVAKEQLSDPVLIEPEERREGEAVAADELADIRIRSAGEANALVILMVDRPTVVDRVAEVGAVFVADDQVAVAVGIEHGIEDDLPDHEAEIVRRLVLVDELD